MKRKNIFIGNGHCPHNLRADAQKRRMMRMIIINATIYLKHKNEEYKKVYDALKIIELMFKDKIKIRIKLKKTTEPNLFVLFHHKMIFKDCYKLDSYIYIVKMILNKKRRLPAESEGD